MKLSSALSRKTFDYKFSDNKFSMLTKKIATGWRREQLEIIWFSCKSEQWIRACGMRIVLESNSNLSVQWPERQQRADDKKRKKKRKRIDDVEEEKLSRYASRRGEILRGLSIFMQFPLCPLDLHACTYVVRRHSRWLPRWLRESRRMWAACIIVSVTGSW